MPSFVVTIPNRPTSAEGDDLLSRARRICRTMVESLSAPDTRDESTSTNFVLYMRGTQVRFIQTLPSGTTLQKVLDAISDTNATPFVVVSEALLHENAGGPSRRQFVFHLCEPSGAQAIHLCDVVPTNDGATLGATTILRPGQTAALHYSTDAAASADAGDSRDGGENGASHTAPSFPDVTRRSRSLH